MSTRTSAAGQSAYSRIVGKTPQAANWIAMGMYAQLEQEWAAQDKAAGGVAPTPAQIKAYETTRLTPQIEKALNDAAEYALKVYADTIVVSETPRIISAHCDDLSKRFESLKEKVEESTFFSDVGAGVASALAYSLLLILLSILVAFTKPDLFEVPKAVFDKITAQHGDSHGTN